MLHRGSNCSLAWAVDGRIMRCGIISSCQTAATSEIVKCLWACVHRGAALYQVPDLYLYLYLYWAEEIWWLQISTAWTRSGRIGERDGLHTHITVICHYADGTHCTTWIYWWDFVWITTILLLLSYWRAHQVVCMWETDALRRWGIPAGLCHLWCGLIKMMLTFWFQFFCTFVALTLLVGLNGWHLGPDFQKILRFVLRFS